MGNSKSKLAKKRFLILGLNESGQSTIVDHKSDGLPGLPGPICGFPIDCWIDGKNNIEYISWETSSKNESSRHLWQKLYSDTTALMWYVDGNDESKFVESGTELHKILNHPLFPSNIPFATFINTNNPNQECKVKEALGLYYIGYLSNDFFINLNDGSNVFTKMNIPISVIQIIIQFLNFGIKQTKEIYVKTGLLSNYDEHDAWKFLLDKL